MIECAKCGQELSLEVGISRYGSLFGPDDSKVYCAPCSPAAGSKGYTLSDMERWREESQVSRASYEMSLMDRVGPDVYFAMRAAKDRQKRRQTAKRLLRVTKGMHASLTELLGDGWDKPEDEKPPHQP